MGDLSSALDAAFDEAKGAPETAQSAPEPEASPAPTGTDVPEGTEPAAAQPAAEPDEPTGDVLLDKLTPEQIGELKKDPRLKAIYKGLMSSYTPKMQQFSEQAKLWDSLNNEGTRRQAVEALARAVGLQIQPTDQPQREQAAAVADGISSEWANVVGPEAAQLLRPLIEKTALAAVNGTLQPLQQATEYLQMDARGRQAEAQVSQFRSAAQSKGWELTPEVEAKMAELGQQILPARAIESVQDGVKHLERLYRLATADTAEAQAEKRILERMNKAAQSAEPARGVPSTGREKRSNVTSGMSFSDAWDVAIQEAARETGFK
ncbi:MAG: hypothetical protein EHM35_16030 [Planctomycetaceae bacterium]|nr:MAG: hypothetical protein EHM35_16030 [Planctomycetaceae bacterium]